MKPDLVGADGASSVALPRFFGTSQSSPHVAGMAALVLSGNPSLTPQELANTLKSAAVERGPGGRDNTWGHGFAEMPEVRTDADLQAISIMDSSLAPLAFSPNFAAYVTRYAATVADTVTQLTVFPIRNQTNTNVEIRRRTRMRMRPMVTRSTCSAARTTS